MATLNGLTVNDTGYITLPSGSTAQRPSASAGLLRYNSTNSNLDYTYGAGTSYYDTRALGSVSIGGVAPASQINGTTWFNNNIFLASKSLNTLSILLRT